MSDYIPVVQKVTFPDGTTKEMHGMQANFHKDDPLKPLSKEQEEIAAIAIVDASLVKKKELKPNVRKKIEETFAEVGMTPAVVAGIHLRNMVQEDSLSTSQTAVEHYYKVTGQLQKDEKQPSSVNIQINVHEVEERVNKIFE